MEAGERQGPSAPAMALLVQAVQELSAARTLEAVVAVVRRAARELTGADGATVILREGDYCRYVDEDAIGPLWKGRRFPMSTCVSGWAMLNRKPAVIPDIYLDGRVPIDAYRPTFVKSMAMIPIRPAQPIGAIGNYWARTYTASPGQLQALQMLADSTSVALENVRLYRELEEGIRARDDFIALAAHELRTPLTSVLANLQSAQKQANGHADARLARKLEFATSGADRLSHLIEVLLDVSRVSLEGVRLERRTTDLVELARLVSRRMEDVARKAGCSVQVESETPLEGNWDPLRLEQVVGNLLSNALKYGAGKPVRVAVDGAPQKARLSVFDHGDGIAPEALPRIFDRYGRGSSVRNYGGFGLGLYVSRRIVEAHGGTLSVESEPGRGATFTVELPR